MPALSSWVVGIASLLWALLFSQASLAQAEYQGGLQGVQVEEISSHASGYTENGQKVYRLFAELRAGYRLQAVYGNERSPLMIGADDMVFNQDEDDVKTGDRLRAKDAHSMMADSWVTIGVCSPGMVAIPGKDSIPMTKPFATSDILVSGTKLELFSEDSDGNTMVMDNGAWLMLDGMEGVGESGAVCIAQIVTTGLPVYRLNLQLIAPDGSVEQWVHSHSEGVQYQSDFLSSSSP